MDSSIVKMLKYEEFRMRIKKTRTLCKFAQFNDSFRFYTNPLVLKLQGKDQICLCPTLAAKLKGRGILGKFGG